MPPASPVPGWSSGEVCTLTIATRRISSSTLTTAAYAAPLFPLPDGAEGTCAAYPPGVARNRPRRRRDPGHHQPEPAPPRGPLAGRRRGVAAAGRAEPPVVVDLGYGASPVTALELHDRLARVRSDVEVVGIEIDPERVRAAAAAGTGRPLVRAGRVRGPARQGSEAHGRAGVQRSAAVPGGRGRRRLGPRARPAGSERPPGRRHLRRGRTPGVLGRRGRRRPARA